MTKDEAIELYIKAHRGPARQIANLEKWDPEKTVIDNASILGVTRQGAYLFANKYSLKAAQQHKTPEQYAELKAKVLYMWLGGFTYPEMAAATKCSIKSLGEIIRASKSESADE